MPKQRRAPRRKTAETRLIEQVLRKALPDAQVEAYRHNSVSIRVRVISPRFRKLDRVKREELVYSFLETLPARTMNDITILLLLAPQDLDSSMLNVEFEHPVPSVL